MDGLQTCSFSGALGFAADLVRGRRFVLAAEAAYSQKVVRGGAG
jgi:hypothetical protein